MKRSWFAAACGLALVAAMAQGGIFVTHEELWNTAGNADGWKIKDIFGGAANGTASVPNFGNPAASYLTAMPGINPAAATDRIFADGTGASAAFGGGANYNADGSTFVSFDFRGNYVPSSLQIYFIGANNPSLTWYYNIGLSGMSANTWIGISAPLVQDAWTYVGGGTVDFDAALDGVSEFGFQITYLAGASYPNQEYYFDNVRRGYAVPEPGTYAALGFALSSMGLTFRRRLNAMAEKLKAMLKA